MIQEDQGGNEENTIAFLKYLQSCFEESTQLIVIWDGATYHRSGKVKEFLAQVNGELSLTEWRITCIRLAPNAPEQNPVEDIWLQGKEFLRKYAHLCKNFKSVKLLFRMLTHQQIFDFPKAFMYGYCSSPI